MLINMLKAISTMLDLKGCTLDNSKARVDCAKIMLDEVIKSMNEGQPTIPRLITPSVVEKEIDKTTKIIEEMESGKLSEEEIKKQPRIVLDKDRKISAIENFPATGMIELDGKKMMAKDAIGKTFTNGRIL